MDSAKKIIVVGGGIAGILAALKLSQKKHQVTLIEKENSLGGLLKSFEHKGAYYDHGTHLLKQTGDKELDELLFGEIYSERYHVLPILKTGTFFRGQLYSGNGFINANVLPSDIYTKGLQELLNTGSPASSYHNLLEKLTDLYGKTFAEEIFVKAMRKLTSEQDISSLDVNAHSLFGLGRIIVEDSAKTLELKKNPILDSKIAFHSFEEGISSLLSFYPRKNGVQDWINYLEQKLKASGVNIVCGQYISELRMDAKQIKTIQTDTGAQYGCDQLIWTLPVFNLLGIIKHSSLASVQRPLWQFSYTFHYETEQPYLNNIYYYHNYDPDYRSFRVTLYRNYNNSSRNNFTVEVLSREKLDTQVMLPVIFDEVKKQIYDNPSHVQYINAFASSIPAGFPIPTLDFVEANKGLNNIATEEFQNVTLLGKASGNSFFMNDVLKEVHRYCENF